MLPADFKGEVEAADIHISPDGRFLYGSNRRDGNDIVIYSISKDGKLSYVGRQSLLINTPRNFAIDPTGNFLLAANMDSNNVLVFRRNRKTGLLTSANESVQVDLPVCLKFIETN
jgi:6-phosphogluconolactonase